MDTLTRIVLIVEYDGTNYYGFQLQARHPGQPTIQAELEKAITKLTGEEARVSAASRTDTGVHAKGQVVSFKTAAKISLQNFVSGLNHFLPEDIAVKKAFRAPLSFSVRSQAVSREYRYYMLAGKTRSALKNRFTYLVTRKVNIPEMAKASRMLEGEHDFASFTGNLAGRIRTVRSVSSSYVELKGDMITFNVTADSFLPHQIRNTVGALLQVGIGKISVAGFGDIIEAKKPGLAGPRVPAKGLFLMRINYATPFGEN
jgi:tRNA pseudouridine38-40 synthase